MGPGMNFFHDIGFLVLLVKVHDNKHHNNVSWFIHHGVNTINDDIVNIDLHRYYCGYAGVDVRVSVATCHSDVVLVDYTLPSTAPHCHILASNTDGGAEGRTYTVNASGLAALQPGTMYFDVFVVSTTAAGDAHAPLANANAADAAVRVACVRDTW